MLKKYIFMISVLGLTCLSLTAMDERESCKRVTEIYGDNMGYESRAGYYTCPGSRGQNFSNFDKLILNRAAQVAYNYASRKNIARNVGAGLGLAAGIVAQVPIMRAINKIILGKSLPIRGFCKAAFGPLLVLEFFGITMCVSAAVGTLGRFIARRRLINEQKACQAWYDNDSPTMKSIIGRLYVPQKYLTTISKKEDIEKQPLELLIERHSIIDSVVKEPLLSRIKHLTKENLNSFKYAFMNTIGTIEGHPKCERKESLWQD